MLPLTAGIAERGDRRPAVGQQPQPELGIHPGLGDHPRAVMRTNPGLIGLDQHVQRGRIDIALLHQDALKRADSELRLRQLRTMLVIRSTVRIIAGAGHALGI